MADNDFSKATVEDYDKSLRDSVNAYYQHALNDPSMSREEAIQSTAEMAERYHAAMEEVQAAHARGEIASVNDPEPGTHNAANPGSGVSANSTNEGVGTGNGGVDGNAGVDGNGGIGGNDDDGGIGGNDDDGGGIGGDDDGGIE